MIDKLDAALRFDREALNLRARRQEVLAANIANADTPNYKARDMDFSSQLTKAVAQGRASQSMALSTTSSRHLQSEAAETSDSGLLFRVPTQSSIDGNTVEMDAERVNFAENALHYEFSLTRVSSKIKTLLSAVQQ